MRNQYLVYLNIDTKKISKVCPGFCIDLNIRQQIDSPHRVSPFPHPHSGSVGLSPSPPTQHLFPWGLTIVPQHVAAPHSSLSSAAQPLATDCEKLQPAQDPHIHMEIWEYK